MLSEEALSYINGDKLSKETFYPRNKFLPQRVDAHPEKQIESDKCCMLCIG